ncbi:MAG: putative polymerase sigma factor [Frankiales bacterium]|nr:putative polymerase sigma factor [Frankiales bacterium]
MTTPSAAVTGATGRPAWRLARTNRAGLGLSRLAGLVALAMDSVGSRPDAESPKDEQAAAIPAADQIAPPGPPQDSARTPEAFDPYADVEVNHAEMWNLVRAAQTGDNDAFAQLYDHYVDPVYRFIYYRVNDRGLAEDFTSETFLRALRRISGINYQGRDIGAWFMTIARNIVFDHSKSARYRFELSTADFPEPNEREPSTESTVLAQLSNERLLQAVNRLGEDQKECIVLRFLSGLSVAETAEVMGKNDGAIKALQHRAVKRLASMLGDELR